MQIILSGLPGAGKTTLSRALAARLGAVYIRADTIEHSLRRSVLNLRDVEDLGYLAGYAVAEDNLRLGHTVVADSVNPWAITRQAWRDVASRAGVPSFDVEVVCSDESEHRRRVETRQSDIPGFAVPSWRDVLERDYHVWTTQRLEVDTFNRTVDACVDLICKELGF